MKNVPQKTLWEIMQPMLDRSRLTIEQIRSGSKDQEIMWVVAKFCAAARLDHWGLSAIARFINRDHSSVYYHTKGINV